MVLCVHNSDITTRINSLYGSQTSPVILCMQKSVISTRITSLHWSQAPPVVLCMQNNENSLRITSIYGSQPSSVVSFAFTTASLWSELIVPMGPRPHLSLCAEANHVILHAQNDRWGLGPMETINSGANFAFCMHKTTGEVWDPWRLVILVLITLFCMLNMTGEVWVPKRLAILVQKTLFCMQKPQMRAGTHGGKYFWC